MAMPCTGALISLQLKQSLPRMPGWQTLFAGEQMPTTEPATESAVESAVEMLYAPPEEVMSGQVADPRIRWVIVTHLLAVSVCLAFSLSDRGLLINLQISRVFYDNCSILFAASLFAWIACPIALVVQLFRTPVSPATRTLSIIAEALICVAHVYVLLPSVM